MTPPLVRRGIWALGIAALAACLILALLPLIASTRIVRDRIATEMSSWSGYRVAIGESPRIEVWPSLRAILTDVTLSEWSDASGTSIIQAERVEIELSAFSALSGNAVFTAAHMVRPVLLVEKTGTGLYLPKPPGGGRMTHALSGAREAIAKDAANPALSADAFGTLDVSEGRIVTAVGAEREDVVTGISGTLNWPALDRPGSLLAKGSWRGEPVALELSSSNPLMLFAGGEAPLSMTIKAAPANGSFAGTAKLGGGSYFDGDLKFSAQSLQRLVEWSGAAVPSGSPSGSLSFVSQVEGDESRVKFDHVEVAFGGNSGQGVLALSLREVLPVISGSLAFNTLDLAALLTTLTQFAPGSGGVGSADLLQNIDLDLRLSAGNATAGAMSLVDVAATAQVKGGLAAFDISDASAFGGNIQAGIRFDHRPGASQMEVRFLASDIDGGAFGAAAGMTRLVPIGRGSVSVILKGPGETLEAMLENADGSVSASFGPGGLTRFDFPAFRKRSSEGGFFALDDVSNGTLQISGAELKANISDGAARIEKAEARTPSGTIWLSGVTPYLGRGLALSGGVIPTVGATAQPGEVSTSFFVGGTWDAPFISPVLTGTPLEQ